MSQSETRRLRRRNERRSQARRPGTPDAFLTSWVELTPAEVSDALRERHPGAWEFVAGSTVLLGRGELLATGIFPVTSCVQAAVIDAAPIMAERAERALAGL